METQKNELAISVEEMGKRVGGLSRDKAYKLARSKGFPAIRLGGRIVIPVRELETWLAKQVQIAQSDDKPI